MNNICPRCHTHALVPRCGGGAECLICDYETGDALRLYEEILAAVPGAPMMTRVESYEHEIYRRDHRERRAHDQQLAEEAAARHGVTLEQLRVKMLGWKAMQSSTRFALQSVIADLTISGLGINRIASVLHKHASTICRNPGLARGRARRGNHG